MPIFDACLKTIQEIEDHRHKLLVQIVNDRFSRWWWRFKHPSKDQINRKIEQLCDGDKEIAYLHQAREEDKVTKLMQLANGAIITSADLRVQVSVDDFSLIYEQYEVDRVTC